jgi:hypothetical protein
MGRRRSRKGEGDECQSQKPVNRSQHPPKRPSFAISVKRDNHHDTDRKAVAYAVHACFRSLWPISASITGGMLEARIV